MKAPPSKPPRAFPFNQTRAVLDELRALGPATAASLQWAEACCEVLDSPPSQDQEGDDAPPVLSAGEAIRELIGSRNEGRFMVATQDQELKADLRHIPSVALLFVARAVLLMEPPSGSSKAQSAVAEKGKVRRLDEGERALLAVVKGKGKEGAQGRAQGQPPPTGRLKKKARGPNPLSVKKGKKEEKGGAKQHGGGGAAAAEKKRKRKHKKKPNGESGGGGGRGGGVGGGNL